MKMFKNPQIAEAKYQYNVIYFTKAFRLPVMVEKESCMYFKKLKQDKISALY